MKLFLDTNVFVEFIEHRKQYESVSLIIDAILEEQHTACFQSKFAADEITCSTRCGRNA
jgi:hypothetical protein